MGYTPKHSAPSDSTMGRKAAGVALVGAATVGAGVTSATTASAAPAVQPGDAGLQHEVGQVLAGAVVASEVAAVAHDGGGGAGGREVAAAAAAATGEHEQGREAGAKHGRHVGLPYRADAAATRGCGRLVRAA